MAGYFNYSKSNNAVYAESQGRYPATGCVRVYGFKSTKAVRSCLRSTEWHHTSKKYNITDYYDFPSALENICNLSELSEFNRHLKKECKARDMIWERAQELIKENMNCSPDLIRLRYNSGFYAPRKRLTKR